MSTEPWRHGLSVDEVYHAIGGFGFSQKVCVLLMCTLQSWIASQQLLTVFVGLEPTFLCFSRDENKASSSTSLTNNATYVNQCIENSAQKCSIVYTTQYESFASEWNLICSEKYKVALVQSVWMFGVMSGALVLGGVADLIGRLKTLMLALMGTIAFQGFSAFAPTFMVMLVLRYFGGICCSLVIMASFVLSQELVGTDWRSFCGIIFSICFAVGIGLFSLVAAFMDTWRTLTLITSVSGIAFLVIPCYIPESPRWLLSKGRNEEAKLVLEDIARKNSATSKLPTNWQLSSSSNSGTKEKSEGLGLLVSHRYLTMLTLIMIFSWFVNSATYYGLTMAATDLGGDVYVSTALSGLIEVPSGLIALCIIDRLGRRMTLCGFMVFGGLACLCIQVVPPQLVTVTTSLALLGKLSISASFATIYIHCSEIFPTIIRNAGMGLVSVSARAGGMLAPFILMLGDALPNLHFTFLGLLTLVSGVMNLRLPETLGQAMPETVADILALRKTNMGVGRSKYKKLELKDAEDNDEVITSQSTSTIIKQRLSPDDRVPLMAEDEGEEEDI